LQKSASFYWKGRDFSPLRAYFVMDFHGDGMGRAKQENGRGEGKKLLEKPRF
jgi:hypothetical protein